MADRLNERPTRIDPSTGLRQQGQTQDPNPAQPYQAPSGMGRFYGQQPSRGPQPTRPFGSGFGAGEGSLPPSSGETLGGRPGPTRPMQTGRQATYTAALPGEMPARTDSSPDFSVGAGASAAGTNATRVRRVFQIAQDNQTRARFR